MANTSRVPGTASATPGSDHESSPPGTASSAAATLLKMPSIGGSELPFAPSSPPMTSGPPLSTPGVGLGDGDGESWPSVGAVLVGSGRGVSARGDPTAGDALGDAPGEALGEGSIDGPGEVEGSTAGDGRISNVGLGRTLGGGDGAEVGCVVGGALGC